MLLVHATSKQESESTCVPFGGHTSVDANAQGLLTFSAVATQLLTTVSWQLCVTRELILKTQLACAPLLLKVLVGLIYTSWDI